MRFRGPEALIGQGWVNYFRVGHSARCFAMIKDWVEKKNSETSDACAEVQGVRLEAME
jgi:Group II intron, maturase-specific domain